MLLFKAYNIKTDREIIEICNPTNDENLTYFIINIIRDGPLTNEFMPRSDISATQAKKLISNIIQS